MNLEIMQPTIKRHKFNIFPEAGAEDFDRLVADIQANGYDESMPVTLYEGAILDGWNRKRACDKLGILPEYTAFAGSASEALNFTMRTNKRRNLTSSQWAAVAVEAEEIIQAIREAVEEERRIKQAAAQAAHAARRVQVEEEAVAPLDNTRADDVDAYLVANQTIGRIAPAELTLLDNKLSDSQSSEHDTKAATKVAALFNTNRTYVNDAKKLKTDNPEAFAQVLSGKKTITEVKKEQKVEARAALIQQQRDDIEQGTAALPSGVFEVVAMDPPWNYGREYDPDGSRVANPYPEMTQAQLLALDPPFADDCVLFLWTTHQFIWDAKALLDRWGFTYKAAVVWDKEKIGMGHWVRMQCEFCLVGIKGKPTWDNTTWRDIIRESRREHSRKPDAFYTMAEEVTVGRRLEYFSREQRAGWEVFGNDTEKF